MRFSRSTSRYLLRIACVVAVLSAVFAFPAAAQEQVRVGGTGGPLAAIKKLASEFHRTHPGISIKVLPSLGSSGGIKAILAGALDVAVSSRPPGDREQGVVARTLGRTPFVFAVPKSNPASGLTTRELEAIYSGRTAAWPDGRRIRVVLRPPTEYDTLLLKSLSTDMERAVTDALAREGMVTAITDQDSANAIEKVPGSLGTITLGQLVSEGRPFKALSLDGVRPGLDTLAAGTYPYFKTYYLVTKADAPPAVREFGNFIFSERGGDILSRCGYQVHRQ